MIERLVFISTMVLFLMIGINAFVVMGNALCVPDASGNYQRLNLTGPSNISSCGSYDSTQTGLGLSNIVSDANAISPTPTNPNTSTQAPGSANSVTNFSLSRTNPISAAWDGISWLVNMLSASIVLGYKMASYVPIFQPIIFIFVTIIAALEGFALMYWTMAGARAFIGRFL